MVIKNEEHRELLLQLIAQAQFPGTLLELAAELKAAVIAATLSPC